MGEGAYGCVAGLARLCRGSGWVGGGVVARVGGLGMGLWRGSGDRDFVGGIGGGDVSRRSVGGGWVLRTPYSLNRTPVRKYKLRWRRCRPFENGASRDAR